MGRKNLLQQLCRINGLCCCSVAQLCPTLWPHGLKHGRLTCPSPSPRACSNSCPFSQWCYPAISSSDIPFSSCPLIFPSTRVFSKESDLCIRWPKYWNFSFSISSSKEYSGLISFSDSSTLLQEHIGHLPTWGVHLSVSYLLTFSFYSWGSQGKNAEVVFHSLLQWAMLPNLKTWTKFISPQYFSSTLPRDEYFAAY